MLFEVCTCQMRYRSCTQPHSFCSLEEGHGGKQTSLWATTQAARAPDAVESPSEAGRLASGRHEQVLQQVPLGPETILWGCPLRGLVPGPLRADRALLGVCPALLVVGHLVSRLLAGQRLLQLLQQTLLGRTVCRLITRSSPSPDLHLFGG